ALSKALLFFEILHAAQSLVTYLRPSLVESKEGSPIE
ncbi:MAG: hypothetical protein AVDCRST_MAG93-10074, partial [uncultured Chloroflexia bacterium]